MKLAGDAVVVDVKFARAPQLGLRLVLVEQKRAVVDTAASDGTTTTFRVNITRQTSPSLRIHRAPIYSFICNEARSSNACTDDTSNYTSRNNNSNNGNNFNDTITTRRVH